MATKKQPTASRSAVSRSRKASAVSAAGAEMCACSLSTSGMSNANSAGKEVPRHAVHVDPSIKSVNLTQLRRIEGQVRGIATMIDDERYCTDIITQIAAVRESLHTVAKNLMKNHVTHCASAAMSGGGQKRDAMIAELLELVGKLSR
jgi:DNA-binding FrmR family transcriptional regulator